MKLIANRRFEISEHFNASAACQQHFHAAENEAEHVAYYNSMYLLQDSTESLLAHRISGFTTNSLLAYLEFWGVLQAAIIQQDSINELHQLVICQPLNARSHKVVAWLEVRALRNQCAGHPAKKDVPNAAPLSRTFMSRSFGSYSAVKYECWQQGLGVSHPTVDLGALLDAYDIEASAQLAAVLSTMKTRWP